VKRCELSCVASRWDLVVGFCGDDDVRVNGVRLHL
jgi:hypothetical protein